MLSSINNYEPKNLREKQKTNFKGITIPASTRFLDGFVRSQENLSTTRFIQDTTTNWLPKAALSRSKADFWEFSLLEFVESGLFYFAAPVLGEHLFRNKIFNKIQPKQIMNNVTKSTSEIKKSALDATTKNKSIATKAGIITACLAVPAMEYALSFAKNLFTLKVFHLSDFNNVANLNSEQKEDEAQQNKVETHAKKELKKAGVLSAAGIGAGILLATHGHKSKTALKFSEALLNPAEPIKKGLHKVGLKSKKFDKFLEDYTKLDFDNKNGKFALSKGQLALTAITGLFGYSEAAKDRGKLDFYEVWTRVPLVVLYTIFGSAVFDEGFKKILAKNGKFPDLIKKSNDGSINVPSRKELPNIAEQVALKNNTSSKKELEKLIKQKSIITGIPYLFSLVAMGFTLTAVTRLWTKYRYEHQFDK